MIVVWIDAPNALTAAARFSIFFKTAIFFCLLFPTLA